MTADNAADLEKAFAFAEQEGLILQATSYMFPPLRRDGTMVGRNYRLTTRAAAYYAAQIAPGEGSVAGRGNAVFGSHGPGISCLAA